MLPTGGLCEARTRHKKKKAISQNAAKFIIKLFFPERPCEVTNSAKQLIETRMLLLVFLLVSRAMARPFQMEHSRRSPRSYTSSYGKQKANVKHWQYNRLRKPHLAFHTECCALAFAAERYWLVYCPKLNPLVQCNVLRELSRYNSLSITARRASQRHALTHRSRHLSKVCAPEALCCGLD